MKNYTCLILMLFNLNTDYAGADVGFLFKASRCIHLKINNSWPLFVATLFLIVCHFKWMQANLILILGQLIEGSEQSLFILCMICKKTNNVFSCTYESCNTTLQIKDVFCSEVSYHNARF